MKITFIGGGNMGEAILAAVLAKKLASPEDVVVSDVNTQKLDYLLNKFSVKTASDNRTAVRGSEIIILAVKPQTLPEVMSGLKGIIEPYQVVLSIIAGTTINTISQGLATERIIRSMPNTPAQVGSGMTVWTATPSVTESQKKQVQLILGAMGKEIAVAEERYLDMATAISGSGPAYFFFFTEALIAAAVEIGFSPDTAEQLVIQTLLGSEQLLVKSGKTPGELRRMVTSPGGTTAAAISEFEKGDFTSLIRKAVMAAFLRATELGK